MSALRKPAPYTAERTETGGWRITLPLEAVPSANATTREHWSVRKRRVDALTNDLIGVRWTAAAFQHMTNLTPVFSRARAALTLYFRDSRRRDPQNYLGGAKPLFDALQRAGWLADDDAEHLTVSEPVLCVDRERLRVEVLLEPWDGVR